MDLPQTAPCQHQVVIVKDRLRSIFRAQLASGVMNISKTDAWLEAYPLFATLSLESYLSDQDDVFLQHAYSSIARYFNYLFIEKDSDGDYLIESTNWEREGALHESVVFNAILALDMENLSRICLHLKLPLRGLFWHDGTLLIKERLIETCYNAETNSFYSMEPFTHNRLSCSGALSLLPTMFTKNLGENLISSMLRQFLSNPRMVRPSGGPNFQTDPSNLGESDSSIENCLEYLLVPEILEQNDLVSDALSYKKKYSPESGKSQTAKCVAGASIYSDFFSCLSSLDTRRPLFPSIIELELFVSITGSRRFLNTKEISQLEQSLDDIKRFLSAYRKVTAGRVSSMEDLGATNAVSSVRQMYQSISLVKERLKHRNIFSPGDRSEIPGFDLDGAFSRLMRDVVHTLRLLETKIFDVQGMESGLHLSMNLLKERSVVGETIPLRLNLSVNRKSESIRSVVLSRKTVVDTLLSYRSPVEICPGDKPLTITDRFSIPSDWAPGIHTLQFTVDVRLGSGERRQKHFWKSIILDAPISYTVDYPEGRMLKNWGVPMILRLTKHAPYPVVVQVGWYSPSGLKLKEGDSLELYMQKDLDITSARLHVLVPNILRPGAFPFVLKVFANGIDIGGLFSKFYKHYQWVFVGPFPAGEDILSIPHPPEMRVNLLDRYDGLGGGISWRMLPSEALEDNGEIRIGDLLSPGGVGYLYTVIKSARQIHCPVVLSGSSPCALFVNNRLLLPPPGDASSLSTKTMVQLNKGHNNILIKIAGGSSKIFFDLGDDESLTSDEFNNNLWELVDGFKDFYETTISQLTKASPTAKIATLRYFDIDANSVSVIGTFNGWSPENSQLKKVSKGMWEISLHLPPGKYAYRFLVDNNKQLLDPHCSLQEPDGYGGSNSVLYVE